MLVLVLSTRMAAVSFTGGKDCVLAMHLFAGYQHGCIPQLAPVPACSKAAVGSPQLAAAADAGAARETISLLVTFAPAGSNGQSFKAHPMAVIQAQAAALQIPHTICEIDPACPLESYRQQIQQLHKQHSIAVLVTGDILDVAGGFMAKAAEGTGVRLATPLWQLPRSSVLQALFDLRIQSVISCVNISKYISQQPRHQEGLQPNLPGKQPPTRQQQQQQQQQAHQVAAQPAAPMLPGAAAAAAHSQGLQSCAADVATLTPQLDPMSALLGQQLTPQLLAGPLAQAERLLDADLCGEHGEYHTLVFDAPLFKRPLRLKPKQVEVCAAGVYGYIIWDDTCLTC